MNVTIQPYTSEYANQLNELFLELQQHEHQFDAQKSIAPANAEQYIQELLQEIDEKTGDLLLAVTKDQCVGFVSWYVEIEPEFDIPYAYISDIVVTKDRRGQGIGQQLFTEAIDNIRNKKIKRIVIGVLLANTDTKEFYRKNGFIENSVQMIREVDTR